LFEFGGIATSFAREGQTLRKRFLLSALALIVTVLMAVPASAQVTPAQATAFFKDFDEQAMSGKGPDINAIYLPGVANPTPEQIADAATKYIADLNQVMAASAARYAIEVTTAAGDTPTDEQNKKLADALKAATDSGALDRVSSFQFGVMKKHFANGSGGVDFDKMQMAMTLFANGKLRTGAPGTREMDQLWSWYNWKNVAALAIQNGVQAASWSSLLPSVEIGLEIYKQVYPPKPLALGIGPPVTTSQAARFDGTKQLTDAAIAALAKTVNGLTTAQILTREQGNLKDDIKVALAGPPSDGVVSVVSATKTQSTGGNLITLLVDVADSSGPLNNDQLEFFVSEDGLELGDWAFWQTGFMTAIGGGEYEASFLEPGIPLGLVYWISDDSSMSIATGTIAVPEPGTFTLLAGSGVLLLALRRRGIRRVSV
jgi:hypothetical protein